jgi:subtilisin family serine protease
VDYGKLSPTLAAALADFDEGGRPALALRARSLGLVSTDAPLKPPRIVVFVHCDESAASADLAAAGVEINQAEGPVRTGIVDLAALDALSENPAVSRIVPARRLRLLMDVAKPKVGIPAFRKKTNQSGKGVVIGIVDTGIETDHPAFTGRILRLWDQTLNGSGVAEGGYGAELQPPLVDLSRDTVGHGTHVAGIASGEDPVYEGVAPGANLVIVKSDLMTAHIADGVRYIFRVARDLGRPAVVNLSLGGHGDAHDGTDSLSLVIDSLTGPGRIVCCAAGNEGNDNIHAQGKVRKGGVRNFAASIPRPAAEQRPWVAAFNGWYAGKNRMTVSVMAPNHESTPAQPVITGNQNPAKIYQLADGAVRVTTPGPDPANGDVNFFVEIQPAPAPAAPPGSPPVAPGTWRIKLTGVKVSGDGLVDLWSVDEGVGQFTGAAVEDNMKVGSPGCCSSAITVASFTTKNKWVDFMGGEHQSALELNTISDFSSEGPLRNGAKKPDVAAPGAMIGAALSGDSGYGPAVLLDQLNRINAGTSMACPFITGMVALLLERDPTLDPKKVKAMLQAKSAIPRRPAGTWDEKWGYGLITAKGL